MSINTSSISKNKRPQKDIGLHSKRYVREISSFDPLEEDDSKEKVTSILLLTIGLSYVLISVSGKDPVSNSYYIYSILFSMVNLAMIVTVSVISFRRDVSDKTMMTCFISLISLGFLLNITIWIITVIQNTYNNISIGITFSHTVFLICLSFVVYSYRKMKIFK